MSPPARPTYPVLATMLALAACAGDDEGAISRDSEPYAGIGEGEVIELTGTEPFWGMTIDQAEGAAAYSTPEDIDGTRFAVSRFAGNNGLGFSGTLESGEDVVVTVTPGECSDGMTDRTYPFTATAIVGDRSLQGCAHTDAQGFAGSVAP